MYVIKYIPYHALEWKQHWGQYSITTLEINYEDLD